MIRTIIIAVCFAFISACSPVQLPLKPRDITPNFTECCILTSDGEELRTTQWLADRPKAIVLGLHGYNDYSRTYELFGKAMRKRGISVIAYDHRGYGRNANQGIWPNEENLILDARDAIKLIRQTYPTLPFYVAGSSMGGAVLIETLHRFPDLAIDGVILNAPAVWGGGTRSSLSDFGAYIFAHTVPDKTFTGEELDIKPTDNEQVLIGLANDPYIVKASRADSIYYLLDLMDHAYAHMGVLDTIPTLLLYGQNDQVIPPAPIYHLAKQLPEKNVYTYPKGYHMLLRDNQRQIVFDDIHQWITAYEHAP